MKRIKKGKYKYLTLISPPSPKMVTLLLSLSLSVMTSEQVVGTCMSLGRK